MDQILTLTQLCEGTWACVFMDFGKAYVYLPEHLLYEVLQWWSMIKQWKKCVRFTDWSGQWQTLMLCDGEENR